MDTDPDAPVLIFDGDCPYCSVAAVALRRLEGVAAVPWEADPVGPFLDAQFGSRPFAMVLVDPGEGRVYAGRSAAEELAERAGTPKSSAGSSATTTTGSPASSGRCRGAAATPTTCTRPTG